MKPTLARGRALLFLVVLCLAVMAAGCATRQDASRDATPGAGTAGRPSTGTASAAALEDAKLPMDPAVTVGHLSNGLTYFIRTNQKPEKRAELWLVLDAGSIQEDDDQQGLAHFVEHMAFNGTEHFEKQEIIDFMETIGMRFGPDVNAYTSFDQTVYMLRIPTDDEEIEKQAFLVLQDWAQGVSFEGQEIDKERGVVLEEWRGGRGAAARMRDEQFPILFQDSRYAQRLPIGKPEIIEHGSHEALRRFYSDWYRPELMAVIAVGDFDPERVETLIKKHFSGLKNPRTPRQRETYPVPDHDETLWTIATDPEATATTVSIYYKLPKHPEGRREDYRRSLVEGLYHAMLNARLDELRQQSDPPFLYGYSSGGSFVRSKEVYSHSARVEEGGLVRGLEALLTEVERVERHGFTETELDRAKKDLLRGYERAYAERDKRRSQNLAREIQRYFLTDEPMPGIEYELELVREELPTVTLEEINRKAREWIRDDSRVVLVNAPEKEGQAAPARDELFPVFATVVGLEIEPYVDQVRDEPLVAARPRAGTVVEESRIEVLDVTEWRLSNGIRVIMKPTDFKNDQILLRGFSPGGTSLVDDDEFLSAAYASTVLRAGGLGEFDRVELQKALAGKVANASGSLGELEEMVSGSASPEDVETLFELLYLSMTAPRKDEQAFQAWIDRNRGFIENRLARPETVFRDKVSVTLSQGHPRRQPPTVERLDQIDLDEALRIYKERFADAGDFVMVLVGNFEPEEIKPLILTYMGGLPATDRQETWRNIGVEPPEGVVDVEVRKGLENKSQVRIIFHGGAEWSRQNLQDIVSLSAALRIRLREVLREDMGGTYGVGVGGGISRRPEERFSFRVSFGCSSENVEELTRAVFDEIERVKQEGVEESYATKVKEGQLRKRETDLKENGFWIGVLTNSYRYEDDPLLVLDYDELVDSVSSERIQAAARRYLDTDQYLLATLYPERSPEAGGSGSGN